MQDLRPILIVKDEADDVELLGYAFEKTGIRNPRLTLANGDDATDYIAGSSAYADRDLYPLPGLVLLDLKLPRRSGFEVLERIRRDHLARHIPVVVLTSSDLDADISRAYASGANSYRSHAMRCSRW